MIFSTENIPKSLHIIYSFLWLPPWTPVNILKLNLLAELIFSQYQIRIKNNYKNKNIFLPTDPNFFQEVTGNTHIIFLGLILIRDYMARTDEKKSL